MAKKLGTLKVKRFFLGTDSGKRGTEVTSSAAELNQLDGGSYTGNVTGDLTGDVTGDLTGDVDCVTGGFDKLRLDYVPKTESGAISPTDSFVIIDGTDNVCAMTVTAPSRGYIKIFTCADATNAVTVTLGSGTFDGTNDIATFDAADETLVLLGISSTRYVIIENIGGVALSAAA